MDIFALLMTFHIVQMNFKVHFHWNICIFAVKSITLKEIFWPKGKSNLWISVSETTEFSSISNKFNSVKIMIWGQHSPNVNDFTKLILYVIVHYFMELFALTLLLLYFLMCAQYLEIIVSFFTFIYMPDCRICNQNMSFIL